MAVGRAAGSRFIAQFLLICLFFLAATVKADSRRLRVFLMDKIMVLPTDKNLAVHEIKTSEKEIGPLINDFRSYSHHF